MPRPVNNTRRQLRRAILVFTALMVFGAFGYYIIERPSQWSLLDAIYMAVITVSTVGFTEVHELGSAGRVFTVVLIVAGVGSFAYLATAVANYVITGELHGYWSQRRMEKTIAGLSQHFIVCAFGRMGSQVADEFRHEKLPVVVVDSSAEAVQEARESSYLTVTGKAGEDDVLRQAGIARARGLVSCLDDDAANLMVVLSARALNPKLFIVARTNLRETTPKLLAAGADRVFWPYGLSGRRMAQMVLRPHVIDFIEVVHQGEQSGLLLEEIEIATGSVLAGATLGPAGVREKTGIMLVAIRQGSGKMLVVPPPETVLSAGDIAIALGNGDQVGRLRALAQTA